MRTTRGLCASDVDRRGFHAWNLSYSAKPSANGIQWSFYLKLRSRIAMAFNRRICLGLKDKIPSAADRREEPLLRQDIDPA